MGIRLERITLRQIRMPLVHFFETSFGRTTERHIILVEVERRRLRLGRSHRRRESVLQRRVDRLGLADPARLCRAARAASRIRQSPPTSARAARTFAAITWRAAAWKRRSGIWKRGCTARPLWQHIGGGRAPRNPLRRLHRHSGFRPAAAPEDRDGTRRRLSAHQDEDQARLGCRRGRARCASAFRRSS